MSRVAPIRAPLNSTISIGAWIRRIGSAIAIAVLLFLSWRLAEVHPLMAFSPAAISSISHFIRQLFPPDVSLEFLWIVARAIGQTLAIATASTFLSIVCGLALGFLGTPVLWERGVLLAGEPPGSGRLARAGLSRLMRAILGFLRAVPDLVWGLFFVVAVGLGPMAGTLALAVSYTGVLGRVYAQLFEDVDPRALEALHAVGATRAQVFLRAIWPQAAANLTAYSLYSFECCVRAAAVLGFIGAGGIGYEINISMRLFKYDQVLTLTVALVVIVALTESVSRMLRRRLLADSARSKAQPAEKPSQGRLTILASLLRQNAGKVTVVVGVAAIAASFYGAGFFDRAFGLGGIIIRTARFTSRLFPPNFAVSFLRSLLMPVAQTLAISVIGTLMGIFIGALLALPATASLILPEGDGVVTYSLVMRTVRRAVYWTTRLLLNALRSIPELVWVLVCIIAVGLGPFPGTIAIGLHTAGVLGKLYADTLEEVPRRPVEAMRAIGGRPLQLLFWAIWPQARPTLVSYTLLRWEMNLRVSTILGLVGGGGLGQIIYNTIQLGFYPNLATLILVVYLLVLATDWVTNRFQKHSVATWSLRAEGA